MKSTHALLALSAVLSSSCLGSITVVSTAVNASQNTSGLGTVHSFDSGAYSIGAGSLTGLLNVERHDVYNPGTVVSNDITFDQYSIKFFSTTPLLVKFATVSIPELRIVNSGANAGTSGMQAQTSVGAALYQNGGTPVAYAVTGGYLGSYGFGTLTTEQQGASSFLISPYVNYDFVTYVIGQVSLDGSNHFHSSAYSLEGGGPSGHQGITGQLKFEALPEPASMATLALGVFAGLRRRKWSATR